MGAFLTHSQLPCAVGTISGLRSGSRAEQPGWVRGRRERFTENSQGVEREEREETGTPPDSGFKLKIAMP